MDRQLLERMVGAGVLVLALVIITPALLDGNRTENRVSRTASLPENGEMRTHTIRPDTPATRPPVARDVVVSAENTPESTLASGNAAKPEQTPATEEAPVKKVSGSTTEPPPDPVVKPVPARELQLLQKSVARTPEPSPAKPAADAGNTGVGWVVQLGSFASKKNAQGLVGSVGENGFSSYLLPLARSGQKTLYRVRVGPPADRSKAEQLASALTKAGYPGQVVGQ